MGKGLCGNGHSCELALSRVEGSMPSEARPALLSRGKTPSNRQLPHKLHHSFPHLGNRPTPIPEWPTVAQPAPLAYDYFRW